MKNLICIYLLLLLTQFVVAQSATITGTVLDSEGEKLFGVSIVEKGTINGTVTDIDGSYSITVRDLSAVLTFSYIGFATMDVPINGRTNVHVELAADVAILDDVVVVGYGTQRKKDVTGAVSTISSQSIEDLPITSVDQALSGQMAGVQFIQSSGDPGGGGTVRIRGVGSIGADNDPLYVVDGFPITNVQNQRQNVLSTINPSDIKSIDVLKDASASAIYGSRGGNGVVIITTKSGSSGPARISLDTYMGFQQITKKYDVLNASEYAFAAARARDNAWVDDGGNFDDPNEVRSAARRVDDIMRNPEALGIGTDWQDEIFRDALISSYELSVAGGNEKNRYFVSGGYFNQQGVVINSDFERYNLRVNFDSNLSDRLSFKLNLAPSYSTSNVIEGQGFSSVVLGALLKSPIDGVYDENGEYDPGLVLASGFSRIVNPVLRANETKDYRTYLKLLANTSLEYEFIDGLKLKVALGADINSNRRDFYESSLVRGPGSPLQVPVGASSTSQRINWLNEYTLNYDKHFGNHSLTALAGFSLQKEYYYTNSLEATDYPNDFVQTLNAGIVTDGRSTEEQWSLISFIGRLNYSYKDKYLLTATIRQDGSSRFGANNRFGTFPSASLGWRVSQEQFLKDSEILSELKFRASYGRSGNFGIPNYAAIGLLTSSPVVLGPGIGQIVPGLAQATISNHELTWETSDQLDLGLELGFFNDRIYFTGDYYDKITSGLLLNVPVPGITGFTTALENVGEVSNKGLELSLDTKNLMGEFTWRTNLNISFNKNEVTKLGRMGDPIITGGGGSDSDGSGVGFLSQTHITQIGSPVGSYYGYELDGLFLTQAELDTAPIFQERPEVKLGDYKVVDQNNDGRINEDDRTILGDFFPDYTFGITNSFGYKNFDLDIILQGAQGFEIFDATAQQLGNSAGNVNLSRSTGTGNYVSPDQPGMGAPRLNRSPQGYNNQVSSRYIKDGSYVRCRSITLGYNFPQSALDQLPFNRLRMYINALNPFTITDYVGFNPEINGRSSNPLTPGVDFGTYPLAKSFTFGLNLSF